MIYASSSEVASGIPFMLGTLKVECKVGHLKVADYVIKVGDSVSESLAFERKDVNDLIGSIMDGRFKTQMAELSSHFNHSYLIVEGTPSVALIDKDFNRKTFFNSIMSATLKRSLEGARGRISAIMTETPYDTAIVLEYAHRQIQEGRLDLLPAAPITADAPRQVSALSIIPGLGINKAKLIMAECGTLFNVIRYARNGKLKTIKGIGPKIEDSVLEYFTTNVNTMQRNSCSTCSNRCQEPDNALDCEEWTR